MKKSTNSSSYESSAKLSFYSMIFISILMLLSFMHSCVEDNIEEESNMQQEKSFGCAFELSSSDIVSLEKISKQSNTYKRVSTIKDVPVNLTIVRKDDGTGGVSDDDVIEQFQIMNEIYSGAGMHFVICKTNIVNDTELYNGSESGQKELRNTYSIENVVNIYVPNDVYIGTSNYCGFAYYPGGPESVYLAASCFKNGSTLSHEIGHHFGLMHTHGYSNVRNSTYELADGSNGANTGDYIQDTPSDPMLSGYVNNSTCNYYGSFLDNNGEPHQPDTKNLMSYSTKACRDFFSQGQLDRLNSVVNGNSNRGNLQCSNTPPPPNGTIDNPYIISSPLTKNMQWGGVSCNENISTKYFATESDLDLNGFSFNMLGMKKLTVKGNVIGSSNSLLIARGCTEICVEGEVKVDTQTKSGGYISEYCGTTPPPLGTVNNPFIVDDLTQNTLLKSGDCDTETETVYYATDTDIDLNGFKLTLDGNVKLTVNGDVKGGELSRLVSRQCAEVCVSGVVDVRTRSVQGGTINAECGNPIGSINNPKIIKPNFNRNRKVGNGNCNKETIKYFKKYGDLNMGEFDFKVNGKAILTIEGNVNGNGTLIANKCGTIIVKGSINVETLEESGGSIE